MTIASEITRIKNNIAAAYTALSNKGATLPATQDSANLATAVQSIPQGASTTYFRTDSTMEFEGGYAKSHAGFGVIDFMNYTPYFTPAQWQKEIIVQVHIRTPLNLSSQWIMSNGVAWNSGLAITINADINGAFWFLLGQSDTSKAVDFNGVTVPQTDTDYWVRLYKPNTENEAHDTLFQISTDGVNWTTEVSKSVPNFTTDFETDGYVRLFGIGNAGSAQIFEGRIYFEGTFISVDGEKVWKFLGAGV